MTWFLFSMVCIFGWGLADLFYKMSSDEDDRYSHLKIAVWVGLTMGITALVLIPFSESIKSFSDIIENGWKYTPASLSYIISMVIGYAGLRYLELSIISPVQNASGAFSMIAMLVFFLASGTIENFSEEFSWLDITGTVFIIVGVIALAVVEKKLSDQERQLLSKESQAKDRKYKYGALALLFPILYCLFDTIGTAADGIILEGSAGLDLGEIDVLVLYGLTFFIAGIGCYLFLWAKTKKPYMPFKKSEWPKACASFAEEFGQIFYVFAMASRPVLAAPLVASYCIVSLILSRIFLKEKLEKGQYACVIAVVVGIVILGISEGLGEM